MKLQEKTSRVYNGKEYKKSWIVIPNKILQELGWKGGSDLKVEIINNKLIIENGN